MDKRTIARIVYDMRNKDEKISYAKMASKLMEDYGVKISRQALRNIYVREVENMKSLESSESLIVTFIINLYCLGYDLDEIIDIIRQRFGCNIDEEYIEKVLHEEEDYKNDCERGIKEEVLAYLTDKIAPGKQIKIEQYKIKRAKVREIAVNEEFSKIASEIEESKKRVSKLNGAKLELLQMLEGFVESEVLLLEMNEDTKE